MYYPIDFFNIIKIYGRYIKVKFKDGSVNYFIVDPDADLFSATAKHSTKNFDLIERGVYRAHVVRRKGIHQILHLQSTVPFIA